MIAVLDYGIGNLRSAEKALFHVGAEAELVTDPLVAARADGIVLPGVGAFGPAAEALAAQGFDTVVRDAFAAGTPFLGICVGFQLLYAGSSEGGGAAGLGLFSGEVRPLPDGVKRPQMQWNRLDVGVDESGRRPRMFSGMDEQPWVYFVHSFAATVTEETTSTCAYGEDLCASAARGPFWGTQFHPEKSGAVGLKVLANFVDAVRRPHLEEE